ncbi:MULTISPECIES: dTMP kinase [unclassified Nitratiruptor]|uniref:dTMP kinase n=1 Tax=unclassified Nitratiruptor TaxID=2624044 RepID=UPI001914FAE0|nr:MULTISPECIES: dTMP kinase [unclassified Nitratiruptor]BCD60461.1 dTMP kinase [Nitratiruptor sp. YY08-10]BCD64050.1 dTMP kinase [Nitratiruptor sp. YY08-14]
MYILFEGIDRAGKSTQIEKLKMLYPDALYTKEPGATPLGEKIRDIVLHTHNPSSLAELFLFLADRAEHIEKVIVPNLQKRIISDRGYISGIAYAAVKTGLDLTTLHNLNAIAMKNIYPDKIIFLELSEQELRNRMDALPLDSIEQRGVQYLLHVQSIMKQIIENEPIPSLIIDASLDEETIFHKILTFIKE